MIGLIVAMPIEAEYILSKFSNCTTEKIGELTFYKGDINGNEIVMMLSGVGKVNAAFATTIMLNTFDINVVVSTGIVGGLGQLKTLSVLIPDSFCQHDMDTSPLGDPVGLISGINKVMFSADKDAVKALQSALPNAFSGILASGDQFVSKHEETTRIVSNFKAVACDMEAGAIAHICYMMNTPFCAIKVVSDSGDDGAEITFNELMVAASKINGDAVGSAIAQLAKINK